MFSRRSVVMRRIGDRRPVPGCPGRSEYSNRVETAYGGKLIARIDPSTGRAGGFTLRITLHGRGSKAQHGYPTKGAALAALLKWLNGNKLPRGIEANLNRGERLAKAKESRNNRTGGRPDLKGALLP